MSITDDPANNKLIVNITGQQNWTAPWTIVIDNRIAPASTFNKSLFGSTNIIEQSLLGVNTTVAWQGLPN